MRSSTPISNSENPSCVSRKPFTIVDAVVALLKVGDRQTASTRSTGTNFWLALSQSGTFNRGNKSSFEAGQAAPVKTPHHRGWGYAQHFTFQNQRLYMPYVLFLTKACKTTTVSKSPGNPNLWEVSHHSAIVNTHLKFQRRLMSGDNCSWLCKRRRVGVLFSSLLRGKLSSPG